VGSSDSLFPGKWPGSEQRQFNIVDNLSIIRGSHQIKAGIDYRHLLPASDPHGYRLDVIFPNLAAVRTGVGASHRG
jgi:hypothetical protein